MKFESGGKRYTLTPEEQKQHEEVLRRQKVLQEAEGKKARRLLEKELDRLIPEKPGEGEDQEK